MKRRKPVDEGSTLGPYTTIKLPKSMPDPTQKMVRDLQKEDEALIRNTKKDLEVKLFP